MQGADRWRRAVCLVFLGFATATAGEAQETGQPAGSSADLNVETFDFAWRKIADTFWDESMGGVDWQAVGDELRPRARAAANNAELRLVLQDMLSRLGQSHFGVLPGPGLVESASPVDDSGDTGRCTRALMRAVAGAGGSAASDAGPGFDVRYVDSTPVVSRVEPGSSADRQGLRTGLEVVRVENQDLAPLAGCLELESLDPWVAGMVRLRAVEGLLFGESGDPVAVEFSDPAGDRSTVRTRTGPPSRRRGDRIRQPAEDAVTCSRPRCWKPAPVACWRCASTSGCFP